MSSESFAMLNSAFANGLPPEADIDKNVPYLGRMKNLRPMPYGAIQPDTITQAVTLADMPQSALYPFPQYVKENNVELVLNSKNIYDSTLSEITTYNPQSQSSTSAILDDSIWQWAVMNERIYFMSNGTSFIFKLPSNTSNRNLVWKNAHIRALCDVDNRLYVAGVSDVSGQSWFTGSRFLELLARWKFVRPDFVIADEDLVWGTHWIMYSETAGGATDTPYYLMMAALGIWGNTVFDKMKERILEAIEAGEIGFMPMRHTGEILAIKPLGARVIVYGKEGIGAFNSEGGMVESPFKKNIGISSRSTVCGTRQEHVFVDSNGNIWKTEQNAAAPRYLGYSEFMTPANIPFLIDDADWSTNMPAFISASEDANTIMVAAANMVKEFDYDGTLIRDVAEPFSVGSSIFHNDTYVLFQNNAVIKRCDYADLDNVVASPTVGSAGDSSVRAPIIVGDYVYVAHNRIIYKYLLADMTYVGASSSASGSGSYLSITWDGTHIVVLDSAASSATVKKYNEALTLISSTVLDITNMDNISWSSYYEGYIVNTSPSGTNYYYLVDQDLGGYRKINTRGYTFDETAIATKSGVALGRRIFLARPTTTTDILVLDADEIMISYDDLRQEYWIANLNQAYVLTADSKLGGPMDWVPTSLFRDDANALSGIYYDVNELAYREVEITTLPMNFTEPGEKQMIEFILIAEGLNTRRGRVQYRVDHRVAYRNSPWVPFSPQGVAFPICSFVDGKMQVNARVNTGERATLQSLELRYISTDKRFRRGGKGQTEAL